MFSTKITTTENRLVEKRLVEIDESSLDAAGSEHWLSEYESEDECFSNDSCYETGDGFTVDDGDEVERVTDDQSIDKANILEENEQRQCRFQGDYRAAARLLFGDENASDSSDEDSDFCIDEEAATSSDEDSECDCESWSED